MTDLAALEELAGAMLRRLEPAGRRTLMRAMARDLRKSQSDRIGRQQEPSGAKFAARRQAPEPEPGKFPVRFLYPKGAAEPRLVFMKSWTRDGPLLTGYDIEAGGIRSFFWDNVAKWLPLEAGDRGAGGSGKLRRKGRIRNKAMFRKLRSARTLKSGGTDREMWVGFSGRASAVARIHQEGLKDKPSAKAKPVRYTRRVVLGDTEAERRHMLDLMLDHVAR